MKILNPVFILGNRNGCRHTWDEYVGTFASKTTSDDTGCTYHIYDVYYNESTNQPCMRYGDEANEYISPGGLQFMKQGKTTDKDYHTAYEMIMEKLNATKT